MEHKAFTVSCYIQGLRSAAFGQKSRNPEIRNTDIVILRETWYGRVGYRELVVPSTKLPGVEQGWDSRGMLIWYTSDITHYYIN